MPELNEHITTVYQTYCAQFESIMSRRFQLLTLVPTSTVASFAITLLSDPSKNASLRNLVLPLGLAGTCFLIGLFIIARINLREGSILYSRIRHIEESIWQMPARMPHEDDLFNQKIVTSVLFSVSLAGWICVALWFVFPGVALYISITSTIPLFVVSYILLHTKEQPDSKAEQVQPQSLARSPF